MENINDSFQDQSFPSSENQQLHVALPQNMISEEDSKETVIGFRIKEM